MEALTFVFTLKTHYDQEITEIHMELGENVKCESECVYTDIREGDFQKTVLVNGVQHMFETAGDSLNGRIMYNGKYIYVSVTSGFFESSSDTLAWIELFRFD